MKKRFLIFSILFLALFVVSCGGSSKIENSGDGSDSGSGGADTDSGSTGDNTDTGSTGDNTDTGSTGDNTDTGSTGDTDSEEEKDDSKNNNDDPTKDADVNYIHLKGTSIEVEGKNVTVEGTTATITASGVYEIDGTLSNGSILVDVDKDKDKEMVNIVFNGVNITNSSSSPFMVKGAKDVRIFTAKDTQNTLTDGSNYNIATDDPAKPDAASALYSKSDLLLAGEGTLTVNGNCNDAVTSKDDLDINGGTIIVNAKDDGIRGKDSVVIRNGNITVTSGGDGIKSDNTTKLDLKNVQDDGTVINDAAYENIKGYIKIKGGSVKVTATNGDGIHAISYVEINGCTVDITSGGGHIINASSSSGGGFPGGGGGSAQNYDGETSLKGIKASIPDTVTGYADLNTSVVYIKISGGTININSRDDGIHSGGLVYIKGGNIEIATDDDGIHADNELLIVDETDSIPSINVTMSYEGFEAWYVNVYGGVTAVYGRDDGWNAAGGSDGSGSTGWGGHGNSTGYLTISGGFHYIKTGNGDTDGIDSNGTLTINGGVVVVECQINGGQGGSFDSDGAASITTQTALGFSTGRSEQGTNYSMSFDTNNYYGNANIAFKPTISGNAGSSGGGPGGGGPGGQNGSYIQSFTGQQPSVITDLSSYNVQQFPNGLEVYYK